MGIQGLLSYCLERRVECADIINLVEEAEKINGIELLVDFYAFEHFIVRRFWEDLSKLQDNNYLRILGGEYCSLDHFVSKLVKDLSSLHIKLSFYIDAARGSSKKATEQKISTWKFRHHQDMKCLKDIMDVCHGLKNIKNLPETTSVRPVLLELQVVYTLKQCGCEFVQCSTGEADTALAKALSEKEKAFAIVSNDSDFCIFKNCQFIPYDLFDIGNDLNFGKPAAVPKNPTQLLVGVIKTERVINLFQLQNHSQLIELSITAGNDFTSQFMRKQGLLDKLDIPGHHRSLENIARWIQKYGKIDNNPILSREMSNNFAFAEAVHYSRHFYNLTLSDDRPIDKGPMTHCIRDGVEKGLFPSSFMSMHNNFYWHRMMLEDATTGQPCTEIALSELRSFIYRMLLPRNEHVVEHGRSPWKEFCTACVYTQGRLPTVDYVNHNQIFRNLRTFHNIMSHQENDFPANWFDRYGRKVGFIFYCLRYFLNLNWRKNLCVSENEFLALVALVFSHPDESFYQKMVFHPTPRCLTIGTCFQDIYRHAYLFLGHLLHLKHEFPLPREVFSGSVWTAFYSCCGKEEWYCGKDQVPLEEIKITQQAMNDIIREKKHMIRYLTDGVFYFDDRF